MSSTPQPDSFLQFWIIVGFIATTLVGVINLIFLFSGRKQKREVTMADGFVPMPHCRLTHQRVDEKLAAAEAGIGSAANKETTKETLGRIEEGVEKLTGKVDEIGSANYKARREMHKQINAHGRALAFIAGRLSGKGDADGERLANILKKSEEADGE